MQHSALAVHIVFLPQKKLKTLLMGYLQCVMKNSIVRDYELGKFLGESTKMCSLCMTVELPIC